MGSLPTIDIDLCLCTMKSPPPPLTDPAFSPLLFTSSQGSVTFSCTEPVSMAVTFAGPRSFLRLPVVAPESTGLSVGLHFRTWNEAGLLLTFKLPQQAGAVWLFLSRARLFLQVHISGRTPLELSTGQTSAHNPHLGHWQ